MVPMGEQLLRKDVFCPDNLPNALQYDQACVNFENTLPEAVSLYRRLDICYKCSSEFWSEVQGNKSVSLLVPVFAETCFHYIHVGYNISSCIVNYQFGPHGVYKYFLDFSCDDIQVIDPPDCPYTSFFIFILVILIVWVLDMLFCNRLIRHKIHNLFGKLKKLPKKTKSSSGVDDLKTKPTEPLPETEKVSKFDDEIFMEKDEFVSRGTTTTSSRENITVPPPQPLGDQLLEFEDFEALLAFRG